MMCRSPLVAVVTLRSGNVWVRSRSGQLYMSESGRSYEGVVFLIPRFPLVWLGWMCGCDDETL